MNESQKWNAQGGEHSKKNNMVSLYGEEGGWFNDANFWLQDK